MKRTVNGSLKNFSAPKKLVLIRDQQNNVKEICHKNLPIADFLYVNGVKLE